MKDRIEMLYYNIGNLVGQYVEFPETTEAYKNLYDYIEKQRSFIKADKNAEIMTLLYDLIFEYACNCEKQGFVYGFKYATSLVMETLDISNK